jgi:hypothetical protein
MGYSGSSRGIELGSRKGRERMVDTAIERTEEEPPVEPEPQAQWERAECTCPDYCERDHELD